MHSMPEAEDLGDVFHLEDPQLVLTPGKSVLLVTESHSDIYMEPENDFQTPVEITGKDTAVFPSKSVESYELPQKSRTTAESEWPRLPECPSPMEIEPSGSVGFLESSITAAQLPEWDGDMCEQRANVSNSRMHWWKTKEKTPFVCPKVGMAIIIINTIISVVLGPAVNVLWSFWRYPKVSLCSAWSWVVELKRQNHCSGGGWVPLTSWNPLVDPCWI